MKDTSKRTITIALVLICAVQLTIALFWASKKSYLFFDEVYSYPAANNMESTAYAFPENEWADGTWFDEYMGVSKEHRFHYAIPFGNQVTDVHPPLFYILLHTASSFVPGHFSFMAGLSVNIILFIASSIALYFLGKEIFQNKSAALIIALLYGVSYGGLNTMVYIRMYMLLTLMTILHLLVYLRYFDEERIPLKGYLLLTVTLVAGVLSQYYFLFIAFFLGVWYTIKFFLEKKYIILGKYLGTIFASAALSLMIWPAMLHHLFGGVRGTEATENLFASGDYFSQLKEMVRIINNDMFTKFMWIILAGIAVLFMISRKKGCNVSEKTKKNITVTLFVTIGYLLLVTKVAPYQVDRYLMPVYPLVYAVIVGSVFYVVSVIFNKKLAAILCILGFGGLSMIHMVHSGIPYTYMKNPDNIERQKIAEEYQDSYALYISDNGECHQFYSAQMLRKYQGFYHVYDLTTTEKTTTDMQILENEEKLVVYVSNTKDMEEINRFVGSIFNGAVLSEENLLDEDDDWNVYLLNI